MNKKLITMIAMLALVSSFAMAITTSETAPDVFVNTSQSAISDETTTVVADAKETQYLFALEVATNSEMSTWATANAQYITDDSWDVRAGFDVNFRIRATQGAMQDNRILTTTLTVGNLLRDTAEGLTDADAGPGVLTLDLNRIGDYMDTSFVPGTSIFSTTLQEAHVYGVESSEAKAKDSFVFNIDYEGDSEAPAGRYRSNITVEYEIT